MSRVSSNTTYTVHAHEFVFYVEKNTISKVQFQQIVFPLPEKWKGMTIKELLGSKEFTDNVKLVVEIEKTVEKVISEAAKALQ